MAGLLQECGCGLHCDGLQAARTRHGYEGPDRKGAFRADARVSRLSVELLRLSPIRNRQPSGTVMGKSTLSYKYVGSAVYVGCVDERDIMGAAVLRVLPFGKIGAAQ